TSHAAAKSPRRMCRVQSSNCCGPSFIDEDYEPDLLGLKQTRAALLSRLSKYSRSLKHLPSPMPGSNRRLTCFNQLCPATLPTNSTGSLYTRWLASSAVTETCDALLAFSR